MTIASFQKPLLRATDFTPTQFDDGAAKADFGNRLLAFIATDFPHTRFTLGFYRILSLHFGMIAHYDIHGFWEEYITTTADRLRFLKELVAYPSWGNPAFTFSDVERVVIARLRSAGLVERLHKVAEQEAEAAERALLNHLQARYQPGKAPVAETPRRTVGNWASDQGSLL